MFHTFDLSLKHGAEGESELSPGRNDRVRKACELCRQMKVKCDGTHPCKHCSHSFHECIYRDTHRKRHADLDHRTSARPGKKPSLQKRSNHIDDFDADSSQIAACQPDTPEVMHEGDREEGRLEARHHGSSGERSFIERLKLELGDSPGIDFESRLRVKERLAPRLFLLGAPNCLSRTSAPLPERQRAQILVNQALDAHLLYHALHRPTFTSVFQLLYSLDREDYGETELNHLPLLYSLMAVGCLSEKHNEHSPAELSGGSLSEGLKYFEICRDMVDLEACDNLFALQAIFFMNIFLISTCRLSRCYTYVSHMLSLAFRMGLHRPGKTDSPVVVETKRSLFWAIWQLLVTLASMCGLPKPVPVEEIGMDYPETIAVSAQPDQERMGPTESFQVPKTIPSHLSYLKLHETIYRVVKSLYPPNTMQHRDGKELLKHFVTKDTIFKLEDELRRWTKHLAIRDILAKHKNNQWSRRAEHELCMAFAHTQVYLYRPFMHYLFESHNVQQEGRKYALAGIRASCNIIRLAQDMHRHDLLFGSQWRVAHMISTSALTLLYVLLIDKTSTMAQYLKTELNIARAMLVSLRPYCIHSQRTHIALTVLTTALSQGSKMQELASAGDQASLAGESTYLETSDLVARTFANQSNREESCQALNENRAIGQEPRSLRYPWEEIVQNQPSAANAAPQQKSLHGGRYGDSFTPVSAQSLREGNTATMPVIKDVPHELFMTQPEMAHLEAGINTAESANVMEARPYVDQQIYEQFDYYTQSAGHEDFNFDGDESFYPFNFSFSEL